MIQWFLITESFSFSILLVYWNMNLGLHMRRDVGLFTSSPIQSKEVMLQHPKPHPPFFLRVLYERALRQLRFTSLFLKDHVFGLIKAVRFGDRKDWKLTSPKNIRFCKSFLDMKFYIHTLYQESSHYTVCLDHWLQGWWSLDITALLPPPRLGCKGVGAVRQVNKKNMTGP